jgi:hypothetical protein
MKSAWVHKPADLTALPNIMDDDLTQGTFRWEASGKLLDWLPQGRRLAAIGSFATTGREGWMAR